MGNIGNMGNCGQKTNYFVCLLLFESYDRFQAYKTMILR